MAASTWLRLPPRLPASSSPPTPVRAVPEMSSAVISARHPKVHPCRTAATTPGRAAGSRTYRADLTPVAPIVRPARTSRGGTWSRAPRTPTATEGTAPSRTTPRTAATAGSASVSVVAAVAGVALFVIDARTHRLPNAITYPTVAAVAVLLAAAALASGTWDAALRALLGALVLGGAYLLLHLVNRTGLGLGDVKLAVLLGLVTAWYGWPVLWAAAFLPFLIGGAVAIVLLVSRRASRGTALAFGPYMLTGTALALTIARALGPG